MKKIVSFQKMRIYQKVILIYIILMLPVCTVAALINFEATNYVRAKIMESALSNTASYAEQFENDISRIQLQQYEIINNVDVNKLSFSSFLMNEYEKSKAAERILERLGVIGYSSNYIENVGVYINNFNKTVSFKNGVNNIENNEFKELKQCLDIEDEHVFIKSGEKLFLIETDYHNQAAQVDELRLACYIQLSIEEIHQDLERIKINNNSGAVLTDKYFNLIAQTDHFNLEFQEIKNQYLSENKSPNGVFSMLSEGKKYWITFNKSSFRDVIVFTYFLDSSVTEHLRIFNLLLVLLAIISAITVAIFAYLFDRMVHKPMRKVLDSFALIEKGNLSFNIEHYRDDEFGYLYKGVNKMVLELKTYINENYEQKLALQKSEFKQLQSQINPHFLYNCFLNIRKMCQNEDYENAELLTQKLSSYYQYITRSGMDIVPFSIEYKHALDYINIQKIRFGDRVCVEIEEIPAGCNEVEVPKIILQPVLENAFEYAFSKNNVKSCIYMSISYTDSILKITIEDNGVMLSDENLKDLQAKLNSAEDVTEKTGLINVCRRIQLRYGAQSGLFAARSIYGGLSLEIIIRL